jgi:beta-xylosidase
VASAGLNGGASTKMDGRGGTAGAVGSAAGGASHTTTSASFSLGGASGNASTHRSSGGAAAGAKSSGVIASQGGNPASGGRTSTSAGTGAAVTGGTPATAGGPSNCTPPKVGSKGQNPLFTDVYTADPAAFVFDCTFYIHCGHDEGNGSGFVMKDWFVLKSTDMVHWTRKDKALTLATFQWADSNAWAGQLVGKDGKFYWFVPVNKTGSCPNHCGMAIGVAVGDSPEGPFTDYLGKPLIDDVIEMNNWGYTVDSDTPFTIDPTVFIDDDGQAYLQYGGFGRLSGVKLNLNGNDVSLAGKITAVQGLTGFFEAPYLTKINGTYYNVYARDANPAKIDYATASNPMGPFTYRGRILDSLPTTSTDSATSHPAVASFAGQVYLVYHVSNGPNGGGTYHREVAVDKLTVNANGTIDKITPSSGLSF